MSEPLWVLVAHLAVVPIALTRVLLRPHRDPASRIAWTVVIVAVPFVGVAAYFLFGEVSIGHRRAARRRHVQRQMPDPTNADLADSAHARPTVPDEHSQLFRVAESISGFHPTGGNTGQLMSDSNATIESMVSDIDAAEQHVHLLFYIWLTDNNGLKVVEALKRAARRGVTCRAMADNLGSRAMIRSEHWRAMKDAGVHVAVAMPIGNPLLRLLAGRIDLRNHRKILIIDGRITYCGSQNCADPEFLVKAKFAPWVDGVIRFTGPVVRQNQYLFASDWMTQVDEDIIPLLSQPMDVDRSGLTAVVVGTGPTVRFSAMPEMFESLIYAASEELVITTPYYIPNESLQTAICSAAYRGVPTKIVFPARNDSWIVAGASRSYYEELLEAGVEIYEYVGGLLHTKSLTLDGEVTLIGSANMDRRSFDLNYENNILFSDVDLTRDVRKRQQEYIDQSKRVTAEEVSSWSIRRRVWNNSLAMLGPIL